MIEYEIDPITWYSERELDFTPRHFIVANTPATNESKMWIINNLRGRFSMILNKKLLTDDDWLVSFDSIYGTPAFEDPSEATLYELKWS